MEISEKDKLRAWIKEQRKGLDRETESRWNETICEKLLNLEEISSSFCIYAYLSLCHEAGTFELIASLLKQGKLVAVPRICGEDMEFYSIFGTADLTEGPMGIPEPKPHCLKIKDPLAPVIVPGLAFDRKGNRIGYGKGYYDRFFEREPLHFKLAIAYEFQVFDQISAEAHDKPVDRILTPGT